jgi:hypothetical protein
LVVPDQALGRVSLRPLACRLTAGGLPGGADLLLGVGGKREKTHQLGEPVVNRALVACRLHLIGLAAGVYLLAVPLEEGHAAGDASPAG